MTHLERAAAGLVDRPPAPPAPPTPLESIERRAESIRRRRRMTERLLVAAGLLAAASILAVVLAATDSDQSLKVTGPTPSTASGTVVPTSGPPTGDQMASVQVLCLFDSVDGSVFASIQPVLEARFASIGRTVHVAPYVATPGEAAVGCSSGQSLTLASNYDPGDPGWANDQISMLSDPTDLGPPANARRLATLLANPLPPGASFRQ
jgi:hypothetical protein